jgi:hypothetical protein
VRLTTLLSLLVAAQVARADPVEVVSPQADSVSVTIYRDLFALVTETRTVNLPEGPVTLSFEGVVETLLPQSAVVTDLGRGLAERNFDYDPLSPNSLLTRSTGKSVTITRTLPGTGRVVQSRATIVAANDGGITLRTEPGNEALHCSGLPERLTFDEIPDDLHARPKLSVQLAAGNAGKRTVRLSYLAKGLAWKSDYIARLDAAGKRMDLTGWITLQNLTQAGFRGAQVQVVAGKLHLLDQESGGSSLTGHSDRYSDEAELSEAREEALQQLQQELEPKESALQLFSGCHALPEPAPRIQEMLGSMESLDQVIVTGMRGSMRMNMDAKRDVMSAEREELGDYQLYRLPWATDLNARQTKQALFLDKRVKVDRFYRVAVDGESIREQETFTPASMITFENRKSSGLGEPLPGGLVRIFETTSTGEIFGGETRMFDKPVSVPVELEMTDALDLGIVVGVDHGDPEQLRDANLAQRTDVALRAFNAKSAAVPLEIRQYVGTGVSLVKSSASSSRKHGDFVWRLRVPANGTRTLSYRLEAPRHEDDE